MQYKDITKENLLEWVERPLGKLIDLRPTAAYNGWKLEGEKRGGHIKGAKTFPAHWTLINEWERLLKDKGIDPVKPVILYAYDKDTSLEFAKKLEALGYRDIGIFNGFTEEWASDVTAPMQRLERYSKLVYPEWVNTLINDGSPPEYDNDRYVICHAHFGFKDDYDAGHIPGAIPMDTLSLESEETWNRRSPAELEKALLENGIDSDTTVIMYGHFSFPNNSDPMPGRNAGHIAAIRCAAIMMYCGVKDVRILNGGFTNWKNSGLEVSEKDEKPKPVKSFGAEIPVKPNYFVDIQEAKQLLSSDNGELVSIRSWEEFIGNVSGYHYIEKSGRIPGAIFGNCGSDAYHMENYRNHDHTMREYHEIEANWKENGIVPNKHIAFYCGTGWRASEAFMNAHFMGWPKISIFDGGWFEWCSDPDNPVEKGVPEDQNS